MGICVEFTFARTGICDIICKNSMIFERCIPLSAGIYDPIFVNTLPFMLKKAQIVQIFSIEKSLC